MAYFAAGSTAFAIPQPIREANSLERAGFEGLTPGEPEPLCPGPGCRGRRHLTQPLSKVGEFRPARRQVKPPHDATSYSRLQCVRMIEEYRPPEKRRAEQRHLREPERPELTPEQIAIADRDDPKWTHKHSVRREDGAFARDFISLEKSLEKEMGIKRRVASQRLRRNGIPMANPGDKLYSAAEYQPGYFSRERPKSDLPPGWRPMPSDADTVTRSYSSQIEPHSHVNFRPRFSYGDKRDITALATDIQSVRQLSVDGLGDDDEDD